MNAWIEAGVLFTAGVGAGTINTVVGSGTLITFPVLLSVQYLVIAVVGGLGSVWGGLVGATAVTLLAQALSTLGTQPGMPEYAPAVLSYAVYALLLVLVVLFLPRGLVPAFASVWNARRRARSYE